MPWLLTIAAIALLPLLILGAFKLPALFKRDPYPPEAADPVVEQFEQVGDTFGFQRSEWFTGQASRVPYVSSGHTRCAGPCCAAEQVAELEAAFDWHAAEYEMRRRVS